MIRFRPVFWWLYANMFPIDGREVYASPPRTYFAHAPHRLMELIKAIRDKQADCPITVVYLLRAHIPGHEQPLTLSFVEAKRERLPPTRGMEQAKGYARRYAVPFVYSTNGHP